MFICTIVSILIYLGLLKQLFGKNQDIVNSLFAKHRFLLSIMQVIIGPFNEEMIFRRLLFINLIETDKFNLEKLIESLFMITALLSNATLFSYIHIIKDPSFVNFLLYVPPGVCFCFVCLFTGSVTATIILHMTHNFIILIFMALGFY